jgi:hypothetical protein
MLIVYARRMIDPTCSLCARNPMSTPAEQKVQACHACANKIGLIPMPPSRRPPTPCARCNGFQFMRVIPREYTSARTGERNTQISSPMYATHKPSAYPPWEDDLALQVMVERNGFGLLEMYICRSCGAVEWYCVDVDRIPAHPHLMTEAIDYGGETPYR